MTDGPDEKQYAGRIEGGIDAIVIGAGADGLAAAAYLGKAGLKTVLLEACAEIGGPVRQREIAPGLFGADGEHMVSILDPDVISDLDLYRHGLSYASRRIDTAYFFEDGQTLHLSGDLQNAANGLDELDGSDAFQSFSRDALEAAAFLRPAFDPPPSTKNSKPERRALEKAFASAPSDILNRLNRFLTASSEAVLGSYLEDDLLKTALLAEASFSSAAAPHEPFSFMSLIRQWAGEASGLQAARAYPEGGAVAVINALRRAVQAAKVEIRAAAPVKSILIEWDRVAGVELAGGGQLRAPIIVAALDARRIFLEMIGAAAIDIGFQRMLNAARPRIATAHLHMALQGAAQDDKTRQNMQRRLVYAPPPLAVRQAFNDARAGKIPDALIIEAIFPDAVGAKTDSTDQQILSVIAHPLPLDEKVTGARRVEIEAAVVRNIEKFAPGIKNRIETSDLRLPVDIAEMTGASLESLAAKPPIIQQWALSGVTTSASHIGGLFFCGPEAQVGIGISCAAGRVAATSAIREAKHGRVS